MNKLTCSCKAFNSPESIGEAILGDWLGRGDGEGFKEALLETGREEVAEEGVGCWVDKGLLVEDGVVVVGLGLLDEETVPWTEVGLGLVAVEEARERGVIAFVVVVVGELGELLLLLLLLIDDCLEIEVALDGVGPTLEVLTGVLLCLGVGRVGVVGVVGVVVVFVTAPPGLIPNSPKIDLLFGFISVIYIYIPYYLKKQIIKKGKEKEIKINFLFWNIICQLYLMLYKFFKLISYSNLFLYIQIIFCI